MTAASTDKDRLVGHAYRDSGPLRARQSIYQYQRDPIDIRAWVFGQVSWPAGARALDVGCGPGSYLATLQHVAPGGAHVGVDLSFGMVREARNVAAGAVADAQRLPFAPRAFSVVVAAHMLYHVPDPALAAAEFARVLQPGGHVLVVLNSRRHMEEVRTLLLDALRDLTGDGTTLPARSTERVTVENAQPLLDTALEVLRLERVSRAVEVPTAASVVAYVDSLQHFYGAFLPAGIEWHALIDRAAARVAEVIQRDGMWRTRSDVACFVCTKR